MAESEGKWPKQWKVGPIQEVNGDQEGLQWKKNPSKVQQWQLDLLGLVFFLTFSILWTIYFTLGKELQNGHFTFLE